MNDKPIDEIVVLIVEDDVIALETYRYMLAAVGYVVRVAETAEAGLVEATTNRPDVILVDLHLPLADGVELLRQVHATKRNVPSAVLTGDYFVDETLAKEIHSLGSRIHFKPLWEDDLLRLVAELTDADPDARTPQDRARPDIL